MNLETWIERQDLLLLENEFIKNFESAGYIIKDNFLDDYEDEFADFVMAKYNDSKTHEKAL